MSDASARSDVATGARTVGSRSLEPGARMPSLPFLWWALGLALRGLGQPLARELYAVAAVFLAGFLLRLVVVPLTVAGPASLDPDFLSTIGLPLAALGALLEGASFVALALVLDVPLRRTRRDLAGRAGQPNSEDVAAEWLIVTAYAWLSVAGLLLITEG